MLQVVSAHPLKMTDLFVFAPKSSAQSISSKRTPVKQQRQLRKMIVITNQVIPASKLEAFTRFAKKCEKYDDKEAIFNEVKRSHAIMSRHASQIAGRCSLAKGRDLKNRARLDRSRI